MQEEKEVTDILPKVQCIVIMVLIFEDNSNRRIREKKLRPIILSIQLLFFEIAFH